ncbi:MAG: phage holin family protein [Chloroflexota bacterium]
MAQFLITIIVNAVALAGATFIIPGIQISGSDSTLFVNLLIVAVIFGFVNAIIKPIVKLVTCPFYILTLGLFTFIVNALLLMLTSALAGNRFEVDGFLAAFLGSIIISLVSTFLNGMLKEDRRRKEQAEYITMPPRKNG